VLLINDSAHRRHVVQVRLPELEAGASLQRLTGPGLTAMTGVALAGQSFTAATATGRLVGARQREAPLLAGSGYRVVLPPASAALLTVPTSAG
jgi:hypothetical protein